MNLKRVFAILLCAVLCVGTIAGCASQPPQGTQSGTSTDSTAAGNGSAVQNESAADSGERPTITFMGVSYTTTPLSVNGSDSVIAMMEEYTNTHVEFTWVPDDSYKEKLGVTLMSADNMPMILTVGGDMNSTIVQAAKAGAFWDLNDFMFDGSKYPNLSQANQDVNKRITVDGALVGIYRARPIGRNGIGYRQDWADKLGLSEPKTIEDLYNMCKAFTEQDPDGNGVKDTYGIALCKYTGPLDMVQVWFGAGNKWIERDGKMVPSHQTDEFMESLQWLRKMYNEGLVYQDWAIRDPNNWLDNIRTGECGIFIDVLDNSRRAWDYFVQEEIPAATGDGIASMNLTGALSKDSSSKPVTIATTGMNGFFCITKAAKTEQDVENCLRFLDKMSDNEMLILADYGRENEEDGWKMENGNIVMMDSSIKAETRAQHGLNQLTSYIPNLMSTSPMLEMDERRKLEEDVKVANIPNAVFNPASGYLINSETYSVNGGNLDQILDDARTQFICGLIDENGLNAAYQAWESQGGTQVIADVNALYQADQ